MADHHTWHHTTCFLAVKSEPWSPGQVSLMEFGAWVERLNRQTNLYEQESQIVETWGRGSRLQRQEAAGIVSIWTLGMELFSWYHWRSIGTINKIPQAGSSLASHIKNGKNIDVFSPEMAMLETKKNQEIASTLFSVGFVWCGTWISMDHTLWSAARIAG